MQRYRLRFVLVAAALPLSALATAVWLFATHALADGALFALACLLALGSAAWMLLAPVHALVRAQPGCGRGEPIIVGGGWSFYLQKDAARGPVVRMPAGRSSGDWWHAGTSIGSVQAALQREDRTLASHPSVMSATLGGWIFTNSHGSGGTLWTPQFSAVRLRDEATHRVFEAPIPMFFSARHSVEMQRRYSILAAKVKSVPNVHCRRRAYRLTSADLARDFLGAPSHLRLMQVGRRGSVCLLWEPIAPGEPGRADHWPHWLDRLRMWLQADVLSAWQSRSRSQDWFDWPVGRQQDWEAVVRLGDANDFSPAPPPLLALLTLWYNNFELLVEYPLTPSSLMRLSQELERRMPAFGRCEVRCGRTRFYLDFGFPSWADVQIAFAAVRHVFGTVPVHVHKGKAQVSERVP